MKKFLNLGCGQNYLTNWTNIDFYSNNKSVIQYDLNKRLPFEDQSYDLVYHSHVLEHFSIEGGVFLLNECYRVLKVGGTIRIVVPDLEVIIRNYMIFFNQLKENEEDSLLYDNYHWTKLELFDQFSRNFKGGEMVKYLSSSTLSNKDFVISRIGEESRDIFAKTIYNNKSNEIAFKVSLILSKVIKLRSLLKKLILTKAEKQNLAIGEFRKSGEIHQWMYDEVSLKKILKRSGFTNFERRSAFTSYLEEWNCNNLDVINSEIRKPDSIFVEAQKLF